MATTDRAIRLRKATSMDSSDAAAPSKGLSARRSDACLLGRLSPILRRLSVIFCNMTEDPAEALLACALAATGNGFATFAGGLAFAVFFAAAGCTFFAAALVGEAFFAATFFVAGVLAMGLETAFLAGAFFAAVFLVAGAVGRGAAIATTF